MIKLCRLYREMRTNISDEERSVYLPYSLDLKPSDYHLFLHRKAFLGAQSLRGDQDTKDVLQYLLNVLAATFRDEGIQKLVRRYVNTLRTVRVI